MNINRHTMLFFTPEGRKIALDNIETVIQIGRHEVNSLIMQGILPGIVRRCCEIRKGYVPVGFISPSKKNGNRGRFASFVPEIEINRAVTPFDAAKSFLKIKRKSKHINMFQSICKVIRQQKIKVKIGLWGSAAMEAATGQPFCTDSSDLDLIIKAHKESDLKKCAEIIENAQYNYAIRVDAEIPVICGYSISLQEYLSESRVLIGKGLFDVKLIDRNKIQLN